MKTYVVLYHDMVHFVFNDEQECRDYLKSQIPVTGLGEGGAVEGFTIFEKEVGETYPLTEEELTVRNTNPCDSFLFLHGKRPWQMTAGFENAKRRHH